MVFPFLNIYKVVTAPDPMPPPAASSAAGAWSERRLQNTANHPVDT